MYVLQRPAPRHHETTSGDVGTIHGRLVPEASAAAAAAASALEGVHTGAHPITKKASRHVGPQSRAGDGMEKKREGGSTK